jgi:hypothetical protein
MMHSMDVKQAHRAVSEAFRKEKPVIDLSTKISKILALSAMAVTLCSVAAALLGL